MENKINKKIEKMQLKINAKNPESLAAVHTHTHTHTHTQGILEIMRKK